MSEANKAICRRFYDGLNAGDLSVIDELISDDLVEHDEFPGLEPNKAGVRKLFEMFQVAFPDGKLEAEDMIAEGDKVFVRPG
jgi:ketosteroid isomerase-like protein